MEYVTQYVTEYAMQRDEVIDGVGVLARQSLSRVLGRTYSIRYVGPWRCPLTVTESSQNLTKSTGVMAFSSLHSHSVLGKEFL